MRGAAALSGEGIVFAGNSHGDWSGKSSSGDEFAAVELDLDGVELWRWQVILGALLRHYPITLTNCLRYKICISSSTRNPATRNGVALRCELQHEHS